MIGIPKRQWLHGEELKDWNSKQTMAATREVARNGISNRHLESSLLGFGIQTRPGVIAISNCYYL